MGRAGWHPTDSVRALHCILSFGFSMWKLYDTEGCLRGQQKDKLMQKKLRNHILSPYAPPKTYLVLSGFLYSFFSPPQFAFVLNYFILIISPEF